MLHDLENKYFAHPFWKETRPKLFFIKRAGSIKTKTFCKMSHDILCFWLFFCLEGKKLEFFTVLEKEKYI